MYIKNLPLEDLEDFFYLKKLDQLLFVIYICQEKNLLTNWHSINYVTNSNHSFTNFFFTLQTQESTRLDSVVCQSTPWMTDSIVTNLVIDSPNHVIKVSKCINFLFE